MKKKRYNIAIILAIFVLFSVVFYNNNKYIKTTKDFVHGSAETPEGTTIVVSMFVSDKNYTWDQTSADDLNTISNIRDYLAIAGDYIEADAASYDKKATFITDFESNDDLAYYIDVDIDMEDENDGIDETIWAYIDKNINVNSLMREYKADNVVFMAIMNTDTDCKAITCTRNWYENVPYPYEIVYLYNIDSELVNPPAVYAHEIYHTFGAPDLYTADEYFNIDDTVLDYFYNNLSNDIMLTCSDPDSLDYVYDKITNETTELTAYYIGLTDTSMVATKLGLTGNQHLD